MFSARRCCQFALSKTEFHPAGRRPRACAEASLGNSPCLPAQIVAIEEVCWAQPVNVEIARPEFLQSVFPVTRTSRSQFLSVSSIFEMYFGWRSCQIRK